jgi:hypothetical protein
MNMMDMIEKAKRAFFLASQADPTKTIIEQNEKTFSVIFDLIRHWSILTLNNIIIQPVDVKLAEDFIKDVGVIVGNSCIPCTIGHDRNTWELFLSYCFNGGDNWKEAVIRNDEAKKQLSELPKDAIEKRNSLEAEIDRFRRNLKEAFCKMIIFRLKQIGIDPAELVEFSDSFFFYENGEQRFLAVEDRSCHPFERDFAPTIRQIVEQRMLLSLLM